MLKYLVRNIEHKKVEISKAKQMKDLGYKFVLINKLNDVDNIYVRSIMDIDSKLVYYGNFGIFTCTTIDRYLEELNKLV